MRNGSGSLSRRLMRPEPEHRPAERSQTVVCVHVPSLIRFDLLPPKRRVLLWPCGVLWTAMPEAAINEDGDLSTRERHVGHAPRLLQHFIVDPIAQTESVHLPPQGNFRASPLLPDLRHPAAGIRGRGNGATHRVCQSNPNTTTQPIQGAA